MREVIMPMDDKDFELLMAATKKATEATEVYDPKDNGWEEIVRCKDCKYRSSYVGALGNYCTYVLHCTKDDFYCADGERKE